MQAVDVLQQPLTPVLAIGSNAGPEQLSRKFPNERFPEGVFIPVIQSVLEDFDVVYGPSIAGYGSLTATLEHSPGTAVGLFVTYLTTPLVNHMHDTERTNYHYCCLKNIKLHTGTNLETRKLQPCVNLVSCVNQYNHNAGTLYLETMLADGKKVSSPVALAAIPSLNRTFPELTQTTMLAKLKGILGETEPQDLDAWILSNIHDHSLRYSRVVKLKAKAKPFLYEDTEIIDALY